MSTIIMASPLFATLFFFFFFTSQTSCSSSSSSSSSSDNAGNSSYPVLLRACGTNRTQNPQSFDINFVDTMEMISQKVAESGFGFASSLSDNSTNRVFGLGQCFNYLSSIDCRLCYAESRVQLPLCLPSTTARVYLDGCFLSYQDRDFSQETLDDADKLICESSRNLSNLVRFGELATGLIQNLTSMASEQKDYYMEGKVSVRSDVEVYGIAQCWRSLNRSGCKECLENARKNVVGCLPGPEGRALNAGCYVRYSTEPFFLRLSQLKSNSSGRHRLAIALGSIFAAVVVIGGAILWRSRGSSCRTDDMEGSSEILRSITESQLSFKYSDLRKATNNFSLDNKIGQGGYGSVYKGILSDGREIAVKRLFVNTNQWLDQFFNEVNLISRVQHKNLVKLFGCSVDGPESLLVYEYLSNTSLDNFLFDSLRKNVLDWQRRFEIIVGTAEGLAYLHDSSEIRIIHRDIKASNILLDNRYKPKISDFGLARGFAEDQSHLSTGLAGTLGYMAPEYAVHGQLTEKADVYSYGILVLEVISGRKNTRSMPTSSENHSLVSKTWEHFSLKTLIEMLDPHLQGQCSEEQVVKVLTIGLLCTQASPTLRPPMWKVVEMLTSSTGDLPIPTQPPYINIKGVDFSSDGSRTSYMFSSSSKSPVSVNGISLSVMRGR